MHKKYFLYSAIFWTGTILFLSLENANELKQMDFPYLDKLIHVIFHFVFTTLWFLYLKKKLIRTKTIRLLGLSFLASLLFGITIEFIQQYFTTTRSGDVFDVVANLCGATLALLVIIVLNSYYKVLDKI